MYHDQHEVKTFISWVTYIYIYIYIYNFFKKESKLPKTSQSFILVLEAKQINSGVTLESSSIKV
jgi:hypothetical protein